MAGRLALLLAARSDIAFDVPLLALSPAGLPAVAQAHQLFVALGILPGQEKARWIGDRDPRGSRWRWEGWSHHGVGSAGRGLKS